MKTIAYIYLAMCVLPLIVNYEPEQRTKLPMESEQQILFWCDCGVKMHWTELPLKRI
jgi:hypothetical protein